MGGEINGMVLVLNDGQSHLPGVKVDTALHPKIRPHLAEGLLISVDSCAYAKL